MLLVGRESGSAGPQFNNCARGLFCGPRDPEGSVTLGGLCYILFKMSNSFSAISNHIKHLTLIEFLIYKNVTPIGIHQNMLAFYGEDD